MSKYRAMFIDGVISALIVLMAYGFYLGSRQVFNVIIYTLAVYGFVHFVVDAYGLITAPEKDKPPKPRPYVRKQTANEIPIPIQDIKMEEEAP